MSKPKVEQWMKNAAKEIRECRLVIDPATIARHYAPTAEKVERLKVLLREAQRTVHCGQYHQWDKIEKCDNKKCVEVRAALEALDE